MLFIVSIVSFSLLLKLCSKDGLKCWSSAKKKIDAHGKSPSHGLASNKSYAFQLTRKDPSKAVNVRWNKTEADRIQKNRSRLITIIECVIFLAKQGLSFRGHREDAEYLLNLNNNPGNFKAQNYTTTIFSGMLTEIPSFILVIYYN